MVTLIILKGTVKENWKRFRLKPKHFRSWSISLRVLSDVLVSRNWYKTVSKLYPNLYIWDLVWESFFLNSPFKWNNFLSLNFSFCSSRISFQNLVFLDLETQDDLVWRVQTSLPGREESGDIEMFAWHFNSWRWSIPGSKANSCHRKI